MSEEKRQRKTIARQERRSKLKSRLKSSIKTFKTRISLGTAGVAELKRVTSQIDKAKKSGIIHKNAASRHKSRMARHLAQMTSASKA